jgi:cobalt/nickel transport system ATP-binding protein
VTPLLQFDTVTYRYPDETPALADVSLSVATGERVALLGPTGAGKSTLLQLVNGLLLPTAGQVTFDGTPVTERTAPAVRRRVGRVFQDPDDQLFLPTLLEDVAFGPLNAGAAPTEAAARAHHTLALLGLEHAAGRAAHHLSGGERRLAALATVLVSAPDLLVLDEPTGDLDARSRRRLVDALAARSETLLVATHDLDVAAALCQRAIVLVDGRVAWDGALDTLRADRAALERYALIA